MSSRLTIRLLDGSQIGLEVQPSTSGQDVVNHVNKLCGVVGDEGKLYGIASVDSSGHFIWIGEREDEELDEILTLEDVAFEHRVRFFPEIDGLLSATGRTFELFFMEIHGEIFAYKGPPRPPIFSKSDHIRLAASILHVYAGPFSEDPPAREALRFLLPIPFGSSERREEETDEMEELILEEYRRMRNVKKGEAIVRVMQIVERQATYGSRFYCVRDALTQESVTLAVNSRGIFVYTVGDLLEPVQSFEWRHLDNLYYKEHEFSLGLKRQKPQPMETDDELQKACCDPTTRFNTVQRKGRPPVCPSTPAKSTGEDVDNQCFICDSHLLCRALWAAAVAQHKFYLARKSRSTVQTSPREAGERIDRLVSSASIASSLPSLSSLHSTSSSSMPSARVADGSSSTTSLPALIKQAEYKHFKVKTTDDRAKDAIRYRVLLKRKAEIDSLLAAKMSELKEVCIAEGELTGEMPPEMRDALEIGEEVPKLRRRVGTGFQLPKSLLGSPKADVMSQLENDIELHRRIVAAADRLAKDQKTNKSVRKKRVKDLQAAAARLKGMELQLAQLRFSASKPDLSQSQNGWTTPASKRTQAQSCPTTPHGSIPDLRDELDDDEVDRVDAQSRGTQPSSAERRRPSSVASSSRQALSSNRFSEASTCSAFSQGLHQPSSSQSSLSQNHPSPHTNHHQNDQNGHYNPHQHQHPAHQPPLYENVGYRSAAPYQSAYRQSHYPTLHEQQISRQRAKSEHSLHGGNRNPIIAADWTPTKEKQVERTIPIMTAPPAVVRSMQTSHSCSAGFSTASLDRKTLRNRTPPEGSPTPGERESRALGPPHSNPSRDHSPSTHRVTTFPVGTKGMCYETTKPLPSSPLAAPRILQPHRFPNTHSAPHFPPFQPQGVMRPVSSSGRMPAVREDPHMEALLDFYKSAEGARKTKTATIV